MVRGLSRIWAEGYLMFHLWPNLLSLVTTTLVLLGCRYYHHVCCVDMRSLALEMGSDLCATDQFLSQSFSELWCGLELLMHIAAQGTSPYSSHNIRMSHYFGSSQGRGQAFWPTGLIVPAWQRKEDNDHGEHCTFSSINSEVIARSCMIISCRGTTKIVKNNPALCYGPWMWWIKEVWELTHNRKSVTEIWKASHLKGFLTFHIPWIVIWVHCFARIAIMRYIMSLCHLILIFIKVCHRVSSWIAKAIMFPARVHIIICKCIKLDAVSEFMLANFLNTKKKSPICENVFLHSNDWNGLQCIDSVCFHSNRGFTPSWLS